MAIPFIFPYPNTGRPISMAEITPATMPCGASLTPLRVRTVGNNVEALSVPYIRKRCVTVSPGIFATAMPAANSKIMESFVFPIVFFRKMSVVREDTAHRLLSIVDSRPEMNINKNGITAQAGNNVLINSKLTTPVSTATYPMPAPINPRIPIVSGTMPNSRAPTRNALPILSFFTQKALCQKH